MRLLWPLLLTLTRGIFALYTLWCASFAWLVLTLFMLALTAAWGALPAGWGWASSALGWLAAGVLGLGGWIALQVKRHAPADDPNPFQSGFLAWFGSLKVFANPGPAPAVRFTLPSRAWVENPGGYRIAGAQTRAVLDCIQPGDILLRGYQGYVDGAFIRRSGLSRETGFQPGWFTHVAVYVGDLGADDARGLSPEVASNPEFFSPGPQRVVHAMARGVHCEDLLSFLRCDTLAVLRLPAQLQLRDASCALALRDHGLPSDAPMAALAAQLAQGESVPRAQAVAAMRLAVLEKLGQAYDFDCSDTQAFHRFSCAELAYYALRGVLGALALQPRAHALHPLAALWPRWRLLERVTLTPDDYDDLVASGALERVWQDAASAARA